MALGLASREGRRVSEDARTLTDADVAAIVGGLADKLGERLLAQLGDAIAQRVVPPAPAVGREWLTAQQVAKRLGMTPDWVYDHKHELGAKPMGNGPRPRLRFHPAKVDAAELRLSQEGKPARRRSARAGVTTSGAPLLPIAGVPR
jgi:hypothetical protein